MFPTASSRIYRNEDGEVLGWDSTYHDEPEHDPDDYLASDDDDEDDEGGMTESIDLGHAEAMYLAQGLAALGHETDRAARLLGRAGTFTLTWTPEDDDSSRLCRVCRQVISDDGCGC